jgi:glycosyltransferase involved in cell wall biosynthesis
MKILIEAYWWFEGPPSGRTVVRSLAAAWATRYPDDQVTLLLPRSHRKNVSLIDLSDEYPNMDFSFTWAPQHSVAAMMAGISSSRFDVVLTQNFAPLAARGERCVFIHDLMFEEHPEWFTRSERFYLKCIIWASYRAQKIFTSSKAECARIGMVLSQTKAQITPIGLALSADYAGSHPMPLQEKPLPHDFLLSVGRINIRKNLEALVRSLVNGHLISVRRPLVIVGAPDGAQGETTSLDAATSEGTVIWTGSISDAELKWAYQKCSAFVFPSLDEGFGLPVVEAASAGARIALSDIPAFREFGDVGLFFDPNDDSDIAETVARVLQEPQPRDVEPASNLSWDSVVTKLRDTVRK